jgi:hypothetical protein
VGRLLLLVLVALLAAGCSFGARAPAAGQAGSPRVSASEVVLRANAACARRERRLDELLQAREARTKATFQGVVAIENDELTELAEIHPPRALERDFYALLTASGRIVAATDALARVAGRPMTHAGRRAFADLERESLSYDRAARRLGLRCRQTVQS